MKKRTLRKELKYRIRRGVVYMILLATIALIGGQLVGYCIDQSSVFKTNLKYDIQNNNKEAIEYYLDTYPNDELGYNKYID
jgi:hypothetical protein